MRRLLVLACKRSAEVAERGEPATHEGGARIRDRIGAACGHGQDREHGALRHAKAAAHLALHWDGTRITHWYEKRQPHAVNE